MLVFETLENKKYDFQKKIGMLVFETIKKI